MKHDEIDFVTKRIIKSDPPIFEIPHLVKIVEHEVLAVCESARGALNFAQLMFKNVEPGNIRLSLHAGSVNIDSAEGKPTVEGIALTEVSTITNQALPGLIYCSELVASVLFLDRQDILFHPVGIIEVGEKKKALEVFTIDL